MLWMRALTRRYLDLRLRQGDVETRIVDRPGRWMTAEALSAMVDDIRAVARATLPDGDLNYGVLSGDRTRLDHAVLTLVYDRGTGRPIAFNALSWMALTLRGRAVDVLHLGLVMVDPRSRSQGLSWILYGLTCFLLFLRGGMRPIWISNVTQVPAVVGMVSESFADIAPTPDGARPGFDHLMLARQIMDTCRHVFGVGPEAGFDEGQFVITNAYTGGSDDLKKSFETAPKHRDPRYNEFCARVLDYGRGDDVLQLGQVNLAAAQRYFSRTVPKESALGLAVSGGFLALQSILLPVLHWLDPRKPWGALRPWKERRA